MCWRASNAQICIHLHACMAHLQHECALGMHTHTWAGCDADLQSQSNECAMHAYTPAVWAYLASEYARVARGCQTSIWLFTLPHQALIDNLAHRPLSRQTDCSLSRQHALLPTAGSSAFCRCCASDQASRGEFHKSVM